MATDNKELDRQEEDRGVGLDLAGLRRSNPRDLAVRFAFGAAIALVAGVVGLRFGPRVGGLFLAFPAVLPAALTLIAKEESDGIASIDAMGGILGAVAMVGFALTVFFGLGRLGPLILPAAGVVWLAIAFGLYVAVRGLLDRYGREPAAGGTVGRKPAGRAG